MYAVKDELISGANILSKEDLVGLNTGYNSRMRSYSQFNLEDELTEEIRAAKFNAEIKDNYQRLLNYGRDDEQISEPAPRAQAAARIETPVRPEYIQEVQPSAAVSYEEEIEDEFKPSSTTMQFIGMKDDAFELKSTREESRTSFKLSTKAKVMFCVYAIIIVTLFTLIILNTRALKALNSDINGMQTQVVQMKTEADRLASEFKVVSSEETIKQRARDILGAVDSN